MTTKKKLCNIKGLSEAKVDKIKVRHTCTCTWGWLMTCDAVCLMFAHSGSSWETCGMMADCDMIVFFK